MLNLEDDNDLAAFSQEAAENFEAPIAASWDDFLPQLNAALPEEKKRRLGILWLLLGIGLLGIGGMYLYSTQRNAVIIATQPSTTIDNHTPIINQKQPTTNLSTNSLPNNTAVSGSKQLKAVAPTKPEVEQSSGQVSSIVSKKNHSKINTGKKASSFIAEPSQLVHLQTQQTTTTNGVQQPASITQEKHHPLTNTRVENGNTIHPIQKNNTPRSIGNAADSDTTKKIAIQKTELVKTVKLDTIANLKQDTALFTKKKWLHHNAISAELVGIGDVSTVKLTYLKDISYGYGAMLGYHFNNQWSIHTGAIYTQKNYQAAGKDFSIPKGSPIYNYKLDLVSGYCNMWDVPLVVRYHFKQTAASNWFVSTGLSSYFMQQERYTYFYKYLNNPVSRNGNYNNKNTYLGAILNLSFGIEKPFVNKHLLLHIEPYAKIPLAGVGYGNIQLSSFGINLSVQHKQPLHK